MNWLVGVRDAAPVAGSAWTRTIPEIEARPLVLFLVRTSCRYDPQALRNGLWRLLYPA